jgi:hypothetical protein
MERSGSPGPADARGLGGPLPGEARLFQRLTALTALVSVPFALANLLLMGAAVGFDVSVGPYLSIAAATRESGSAALFHLAMLADMVGYYLLLIPLALFLGRWLHLRSPSLSGLAATFGLGYILLGALGAAVLSAVWPPLLEAYRQAEGERRDAVELLFQSVSSAIFVGVWNTLVSVLFGLWLLSVGLLVRRGHRAMGTASVVLGAVSLVDAAAAMAGARSLHAVVLYLYLLGAPVWALAWGVLLLRSPPLLEHRETP